MEHTRDPDSPGTTVSPTWTLATQFPALAGTFVEDLIYTGVTVTPSPSNPNLISLAFTVALGPAWTQLGWLAALIPPTPLTGQATLTHGAPAFALSAPLSGTWSPAKASPLALGLSLSSVVIADAPPGPDGQTGPAAVPSLRLTARLPIGPGLPISVDLSNPVGLLMMAADASQFGQAALTGFTELLGAVDLPVPSQWDPSSWLSLAALVAAVDPTSGTPAWFRLDFAIQPPPGHGWSLAGGLTFDGATLSFLVPWAGGPGTPSVSLGGTVDVVQNGSVKGTLDVALVYPGWQLQGALSSGTLPLTALTDPFVSGLPDLLDISVLEIYLDPTGEAVSLSAALTGDWSIKVWAVTLALTEVGLDLDWSRSGGGSGDLYATASFTSQPTGAVTFSGVWAVPGGFSLAAAFPDIDLSALAKALLDLAELPIPLPTVDLTQGTVTIAESGGTYDLALSAAVQVNGKEVGAGAFEVRTGSGGTGFLLGVKADVDWTPATVWSELGGIFDALHLINPGLILTTLSGGAPNLPILADCQAAPATLTPGVVLFTTLALEGAALGPLANFLPDLALQLTGVIPESITQASFKAAWVPGNGPPATRGFIQLDDFFLQASVGALSLTVGGDGTLQVPNLVGSGTSDLNVQASGSIALADGGGFVQVGVTSWTSPFGLTFFAIDEFFVKVGVDIEGVEVGASGSITIGEAPRQFTFTLAGQIANFEWPSALLFTMSSSSQPLLLSDLAALAGVPASVQSILDQVPLGVSAIVLYLVTEPFQIGTKTYLPGVAFDLDALFYKWAGHFEIQLTMSAGLVAGMSISAPIPLFDVGTLADATFTKGPSGSIDTTALLAGKPYCSLSGGLEILGSQATLSAQAQGTTFSFDLEFDVAGAPGVSGLLTFDIDLTSGGSAELDLPKKGSPPLALSVTLGPYAPGGITLVPAKTTLTSPSISLSGQVTVGTASSFSLQASFEASDVNFDFAISLTAAELTAGIEGLAQDCFAWMKANVAAVFGDVVSDARAWVSAIEAGLLDFGGDIESIAEALAKHFADVSVTLAVELLSELGFGLTDIAAALVKWFGVSAADALEVVENALDSGGCALDDANELLSPAGPSAETLAFALLGTDPGECLLAAALRHAEALRARVGTAALGRIAASPTPAAAALAVIDRLERGSGPETEALRSDLAAARAWLTPWREHPGEAILGAWREAARVVDP